MRERWLPIAGFPGYEVSDFGRVRSVDRIVMRRDRQAQRCAGRTLEPTPNDKGYQRVTLYHCDGATARQTTVYVHKLVLLAFVGQCPNGLEGCHDDGDKRNNRLSKLRYDTPKGNALDRRRHGTQAIGSRSPNARLTEDVVRAIRLSTESLTALAARHNVSRDAIRLARDRINWSHVK